MLVSDYIDVTQFDRYIFVFYIRCFSKHSSHFSSIDVTPFILRCWRIVCAECGTVWSGEWVCSRWLCGGCVCVGNIWVGV